MEELKFVEPDYKFEFEFNGYNFYSALGKIDFGGKDRIVEIYFKKKPRYWKYKQITHFEYEFTKATKQMREAIEKQAEKQRPLIEKFSKDVADLYEKMMVEVNKTYGK